jgi:hypothetical protein
VTFLRSSLPLAKTCNNIPGTCKTPRTHLLRVHAKWMRTAPSTNSGIEHFCDPLGLRSGWDRNPQTFQAVSLACTHFSKLCDSWNPKLNHWGRIPESFPPDPADLWIQFLPILQALGFFCLLSLASGDSFDSHASLSEYWVAIDTQKSNGQSTFSIIFHQFPSFFYYF